MSLTTLDHPDPVAERDDPARSGTVAAALTACYELVGRGEYEVADKRLDALTRMGKSPKQDLRILYMRATTLLRLNKLNDACALLDEGIEQSERFMDYGALAQLAYLYATAQRELDHPVVAARYCEVALEAWRLYLAGKSADQQDAIFELDALILLNQLYFFSGKYVQAESVFRVARRLAERSQIPPVRRGNLAWIEANFYRWRSEPGKALESAMAALTVLDEHGTLMERSRLRMVIADIAMDLAERYNSPAHDGANQHFLGLAETFVTASLDGLSVVGNPFALALTRLACARLYRLARRNVDRHKLIDGVGSFAIEAGDRTVQGQVWSARGDEYLDEGEYGQAVNAYLEAITLLKDADMQGHSVWAMRALRIARQE